MNLQEPVQPRPSANGLNLRRVEKERIDSRLHPGKLNPNRVAGLMSSNRGGNYESPSQDRLIYLSTCLIGHHVEVQVKNGSIFSGIFHSTNADEDFGIVLRMSRLIKDSSVGGQKAASNTLMKAPSKTQIIPAQEFVQIMAKDVPVYAEGLNSYLTPENQELLLDSNISKSHQLEGERLLEPWLPDEEDPRCGELENVFDKPWTGLLQSWDQFKVNETLFGVKSTFNEELYTTKLDKGPRMREVEEKATRIAREIEDEDTHDLHLAEERGIYCQGYDEIDEETRYSSVFRGVDDSGYADEDALMDERNNDTFGDSSPLASGRSFADVAHGKIHDGDQGLPSTSLADRPCSSLLHANREPLYSGSPVDEHICRSDAIDHDARVRGSHFIEVGQSSYGDDYLKTQAVDKKPRATTAEDLQTTCNSKEDTSVVGVPSAEAATSAVSNNVVKNREKPDPASEPAADAGTRKVQGLLNSSSHGKPSSSASVVSKGGGASPTATGPALSPSSSMSSLTSEKSTLNPNAKEFKLNPNAKVFVPTQSSPRPASPVAVDNSFYFPASMPAVPPMHGMHAVLGVGPSYSGHQPMMLSSQAPPPMLQPQQMMYFLPNGPQMMVGHPRQQVMYMQPPYPTEMGYRGREF